jgi:hypothetical protein
MHSKETITDRVVERLNDTSLWLTLADREVVEELQLFPHSQTLAVKDSRRKVILFFLTILEDIGMQVINKE